MKTLSIPLHHRSVLLAASAVLLAAGLTRPAPLIPSNLSMMPVITTSIPARPASPEKAAETLPFSMQDVIVSLSATFHMQPTESGADFAKFIYADQQLDGTSVEVMRIAVRERGEQIQVVFAFREFNAMHYVAEFIEGPLFTRTESEQLYALLYPRGPERGWQQVGRFHARAALVSIGEDTEASFEFAANPPRG